MADNYGVSFAPTTDNSQQGPLNGQIDGLPAAIKILALRFPKFFGASSPAAPQLLNGHGAQGIDPIASAVLSTMAQTIGRHSQGLPGGTAGPNPPMPHEPNHPGPFGKMPPDPGPGNSTDVDYSPRIVFNPGAPQRPPLGGGAMGPLRRMGGY